MEINIRSLTPSRLPDYLEFFDHVAFTDNQGWSGCYCHFYFADHQEKDWEDRDGAENRQAVSQLIQAGEMHGYLAYEGDEVVGWCNAGLRKNIRNIPPAEDLPASADTGIIACFVIAPGYRGQGIASRLLESALEGFRWQGVKLVEALPRHDTDNNASNYHGPLSMYLAAGFEPVQKMEYFTLVRKTL